jgi:MFS family permease
VKEWKERKFKVNLTKIIIAASMIQLLRTIFYAGTVNFIPTYLVKELHLDIAAAGVSTSIMLILGIVSQPLGGHMSDRIGRRAVLVLSSFLMGFFFILFLWIPYPTSLVLLSLVGFWIFLGFPIPYAVVGDYVPKESISTSLGIISGLGSAGGIIAPLFIGSIGDQIGLGNAMFFSSIFAFIAAAGCFILPKGARNKNYPRMSGAR